MDGRMDGRKDVLAVGWIDGCKDRLVANAKPISLRIPWGITR